MIADLLKASDVKSDSKPDELFKIYIKQKDASIEGVSFGEMVKERAISKEEKKYEKENDYELNNISFEVKVEKDKIEPKDKKEDFLLNVKNLNNKNILKENINPENLQEKLNAVLNNEKPTKKNIISNNKLENNDNKLSLSQKDKLKKELQKKGIEITEVNNALVFNVKFQNLDTETKEKIKSIINDTKTNKIDENKAKKLILDLVFGNKLKDFVDFDKINTSNLNIKKDKNDTKDNKIVKFDFKKEEKQDIQIKDLKTDENKVESQINEKKDSKKIAEKTKNILDTKEKDSDIKDFKQEIRLDVNDNKLNSTNPKERSAEVQRVYSDNREKIFDTIAKNTKIIFGNDETRFTTMIRPDNLGRVDLKFVMKDGKMDGRIILQNQEAVDFFRSNVEELRAVFQKSNVELGKIDIALAGAGLNYGESASGGNNSNQNPEKVFSQNFSVKAQKVFEDNSFFAAENYYQGNDKRVNIFI
ncbi:MAG: hypothetical protein A2086_02490 [Spirochaetes bacterium GWD1_27_9]|nr:MAG: hypothetical protein A2Y34_16090 [Spirochaetes bacterium GWC1_27_15]OHD30445.1 MAG: hypothetical protein A2086_02490 [Spirochaetes bacterium GWD1_27_9]